MAGKRTHCISCGATLLDDIVIIGDQYPSAVYPDVAKPYDQFIKRSSLNVTKCSNTACGLVQLSNLYNLDYVFEHYPYVSGSTATMGQILTDVAKDAQAHVQLTPDDIILDIGGNDGTLLKLTQTPVKRRVNIDAAHGIQSVLTDPDYVRLQTKFSRDSYKSLGLAAPKLIYSVAMFYHLDNPISFCQQVADVMSGETVWLIQMTYLGSMLADNIYDNIVHEHVAYYSLASLESLLAQVGLEVFDAQVVQSYGGSIRAYVRKKTSSSTKSPSYHALVAHESQTGMNTVQALASFNDRVQLLRTVTRNWLFDLADKHGPLFALGASTKGNMICQFLGVNQSHIKAVLDNNDKKIGSILVGSDIPILDESKHLPSLTPYTLILPYYYTDFFARLVARFTPPGQTRTLFVPLPQPYVVVVPKPAARLG
jgi:NDP-4-keto-2,6-dideoxyhexose 3-C-methyltransferase